MDALSALFFCMYPKSTPPVLRTCKRPFLTKGEEVAAFLVERSSRLLRRVQKEVGYWDLPAWEVPRQLLEWL